MYYNSFQLKKITYIMMIIGIIFLIFGFYKWLLINNEEIKKFIQTHPDRFAQNFLIKKEENQYVQKLFHQANNRPWSALYTTALYFIGISLGALFFLSLQYVSQAGWSIVIIRIIEVVASFIPFGGVIILIIIILNSFGLIHMFHWMDHNLYDPNSLKYDIVLLNKNPFLNISFYLIRTIIYLLGWTFFIYWMKKISKKLDETYNIKYHNKLYNISVVFIVFFSITSIGMGWDWIMSLNPHWFSTLFSWYVLSSYLVTAITTITIISIYLKKQGLLMKFNDHHLHDLVKYIFATSLLWSYFWFIQFLLYWYGNIPEEISYFFDRTKQYNNIHFWMLIPNLILPLFGLISSKIKRKSNIILIFSYIILIGHYIDIYNMIMPGTVGGFYGFDITEVGSFLFITGLFIFIITKSLNKLNIEAKGNKFFHESEIYEYPY